MPTILIKTLEYIFKRIKFKDRFFDNFYSNFAILKKYSLFYENSVPYIYPTPLQDVTQGQFLSWFEFRVFLFPDSYLLISRNRIAEFIYFPRAFTLSKTQTAWYSIWTRVIAFIFCNDNCNSTSAYNR